MQIIQGIETVLLCCVVHCVHLGEDFSLEVWKSQFQHFLAEHIYIDQMTKLFVKLSQSNQKGADAV